MVVNKTVNHKELISHRGRSTDDTSVILFVVKFNLVVVVLWFSVCFVASVLLHE